MPKMEKKFRISNRRYLGSKLKLVDFIKDTIRKENIKFSSFLDLFAGTGVVGASFNNPYTEIVLNDILESNRCAYNSFMGSELIDESKLMDFINLFNKKEVIEDNYFSLNFSDTFFSKKNCKKIGWIRDYIDKLFEDGLINKREKDYLITSLLYAMDRIANTVGHYDAFRRNGNLERELVLYPLEIFDDTANKNNKIFSKDANELAKDFDCDLVYIDPPYNSRQYCDAYHLLENVALWKKPKVYGAARKMDRNSLKSRYCENSAPRVFANLIKDLKCKYIIVSYSNTGLQGACRSQAKITDVDILGSLRERGKVSVYEIDFNQFTTGKTKINNHKERLFVCKVGVFEEQKSIKVKEFVKSPLNYTGGKYKLLGQLTSKFPNNIGTFVDLFGGGFNVGANVEADRIIYNDSCKEVSRLIKLFWKFTSNEIIEKLDNLIGKYSLSDSEKNGYEYYGCNSNNGLGSYNKDSFIKLRSDYNMAKTSISKDFLLLLLNIYSFNNQIRFNSNGEFNLPVGKRDLNASIRRNIKLFAEKIKSKNILFLNEDFKAVKPDNFEQPFYYCDPPYLLGDACYNENDGRNINKEKELLAFLLTLSNQGVNFALSNVIEHKGRTNDFLIKRAFLNRFNIIYLDKDYSNSNYHSSAKDCKTTEVLITNY